MSTAGAWLARGAAPHPRTQPPRSEQDPETWWTAFETAWAQADSPAVAALAVAGQQHGMVVLDDAQQVVRPAKLWNDTESAVDAEQLIDLLRGGAGGWAAACGTVPVASLTITKLRWLRRSEPRAWDALAHVVLPHDWLTFRLTGRLATDRGDASGTGYWSPASNSYRHDLLGLVDPDRDWAPWCPRCSIRTAAPARGTEPWWLPARATTWRAQWGSGSDPATWRYPSERPAPSIR